MTEPVFSKPRANLVTSSSGYSVEVLGMTGIRYAEGERSIFVDSEVLSAPAAVVIYRKSIRRWDPPHDIVPVEEQDRERIVGNIRRAFESQGWELEVINASG